MIQLPTTLALTSAASQEPVRLAAQLTPGSILTGVLFETVRLVVEVDRGNVLTSQIHPHIAPLHPGHLHNFTMNNNCACACGLRRDPIGVFLPGPDSNWARAFKIIPEGPLTPIARATVYALLPQGHTDTTPLGEFVIARPNWGRDLPIVPRLGKIWEIPAGLRGLLEE